MEGDVEAILPRPHLPPVITSAAAAAVEDDDDSASAHLQGERETRGEREKWEAWHACAGLSRTEAKRQYVEVLIQTMKIYAAGTPEARELVADLEFVWDQIRSLSGGSDEESLRGTARAGVRVEGPAVAAAAAAEAGEEGGGAGRLRVLSPVSRGGSGEIVEGEDASIPEREEGGRADDDRNDDDDDDDDNDEGGGFRDASKNNPDRPLDRRRLSSSPSTRKWRGKIETALTKISTEMAALREQIDELNSSSSSSSGRSAFTIGRRRRRKGSKQLLAWMRWILWIAMRQLAVDALVLAALLGWGVWSRDDRFERWVGRRWGQLRRLVEGIKARRRRRWWVGGRWKWDWVALLAVVVPPRFL